jgi:exodeoxyribonuclease VIII
MTEAVKGLSRGLPFAEYNVIEAASHTRLSALRRSPRHLLAMIESPPAPTLAHTIGAAFHTLTLEPDRFHAQYVVADQCAATTKAGIRCSNAGSVRRNGEWFCRMRGHDPEPGTEPDPATVLDMDSWAAVFAMRDAVMAHPLVGGIIERAEDRELSVLWTDARTGQDCKARWDAPDADACVILDLKSCEDASPAAFRRSLGRYGYYRQHALYMSGAAEVAPGAFSDFLFAAVEKTEPHCVAVYRLPESAVELGDQEIRRLLARYRECATADAFPGYSDEVIDLDVPQWAYWELDS